MAVIRTFISWILNSQQTPNFSGDRRIISSGSASTTQWVQSRPGPHETLPPIKSISPSALEFLIIGRSCWSSLWHDTIPSRSSQAGPALNLPSETLECSVTSVVRDFNFFAHSGWPLTHAGFNEDRRHPWVDPCTNTLARELQEASGEQPSTLDRSPTACKELNPAKSHLQELKSKFSPTQISQQNRPLHVGLERYPRAEDSDT